MQKYLIHRSKQAGAGGGPPGLLTDRNRHPSLLGRSAGKSFGRSRLVQETIHGICESLFCCAAAGLMNSENESPSPLERLPGGSCTHWKAPPLHGAHPKLTSQSATSFEAPCKACPTITEPEGRPNNVVAKPRARPLGASRAADCTETVRSVGGRTRTAPR